MAVGTLTLTAQGRAKLARFLVAVRQEASAAVGYAAVELKSAVADAAPSPEEEGRLLSEGVGVSGGGLAAFGTPEGGRFLRQGTMVSLREAIQSDPLESKAVTPDRFVAGFGSPTRINAKTGFSWQTRRRGIQGPTLPFNQAYVQALENGGVIWKVVPRPGTRILEPEPGRFAREMYKTLAPRRMFRGTLFLRQTRLKARMAAEIRQAARSII